MYFLIASGKEIVTNHSVPLTNVWTIDSSSNIILQQWLYDVFIYLFGQYDFAGLVSFVLIQLVCFVIILWHFLGLKNINKYLRAFFIFTIVIFNQIYVFSIRPELVTLSLLLLECIVLEKYSTTKKWTYLLWLVPIMLLEMNLHGSMWPIHFAILLAYCVPAFYLPNTENVSIKCGKWLSIIIPMLGILFVNPYGIDGILYIIKSFKADTFDYINVVELQDATFLSGPGVSILIALAFIVVCYRLKVLTSTTLNITLGFCLLAAYAIRNNMFMVISYAFLLRDLSTYLTVEQATVNWRKDVKNYFWPILVALNLFLMIFIIPRFGEFCKSDISEVSQSFEEIYNNIQENYNEDMHVFTGFNVGAYMEYRGMKNVYMDARPELYTSVFTGDKNILRDYSLYCVYGFNNKDKTQLATREEMDKWFASYDFDYVILNNFTEMYLSCYMRGKEGYELVEISDSTYSLYKKKGL